MNEKWITLTAGPDGAKPAGFAVTAAAYGEFVHAAGLRPVIAGQIRRYHAGADLRAVGPAIRTAFCYAQVPDGLTRAIVGAYKQLGGDGTEVEIGTTSYGPAVTGESSFVVDTGHDLVAACKRCFASAFTNQAIESRERQGLDHLAATSTVIVRRRVPAPVADVPAAAGKVRIPV